MTVGDGTASHDEASLRAALRAVSGSVRLEGLDAGPEFDDLDEDLVAGRVTIDDYVAKGLELAHGAVSPLRR